MNLYRMKGKCLILVIHSFGHAIENLKQLPCGFTDSIGMVREVHFSEVLSGFKHTDKLILLLTYYGLAAYADYDTERAFEI